MSFDKKIFASGAKTGELVEFPDVKRGWGATIDETNRVPPMSWFNGAFNRVDENMGLIAVQGILEWQDDLEYKKGSITKKDGALYIALKDNTSTKVTDTECWFILVGDTAGEIDSAIKNAISAHEQSRNHPDASLTEKGFVKLSNTVTSTSAIEAATANAVKTAYDRGSLGVTNAATAQTAANNAQSTATAALPKAGGAMTGQITMGKNKIDMSDGWSVNSIHAGAQASDSPAEIGETETNLNFRVFRGAGFIDNYMGSGNYGKITIGFDVRAGKINAKTFNGTATNSQKLEGKELSYFAPSADAVLKSNLLQTTGTSTDNTMSQKAITDALNNNVKELFSSVVFSHASGTGNIHPLTQRVFNTTYTNNSDKPMFVAVTIEPNGGNPWFYFSANVNDRPAGEVNFGANETKQTLNRRFPFFFIVPARGTYVIRKWGYDDVANNPFFYTWLEMR